MEVEKIADRVFGKDNRAYLMGIAMLWIVVFHVCTWSETSGISTGRFVKLFGDGAVGVDVFLLLSAYGLQASLEKNSIKRFYINRIRRLFPVYILFLITLFLTFERNCPIDRMFIQSLFQITGLSLFQYPDFFSCGFCFDWFTPAIIILYVLYPMASRFIKLIIGRGILYEALFLLFLVFVGVLIRENKHFPFGLLALRFPVIFLGGAFYVHLKELEGQKVLILCFIAACTGLISGNVEMKRSLLLLPILLSFSIAQFHLPLKRIVCIVGRHSFEVYLAHIIIVAFFIPAKMITNFFYLFIVALVSTLIITIVYSFFQKTYYTFFPIYKFKSFFSI